MNVLSLFDGMSCGQLALRRAGIEYENYYASEIDKYAIQIAKKNFPDTIHIGDVTKVKGSDLPKIDMIIGGSPCQGFSFAGKMLNFEDPRSALFFEFVRLLHECQPKYFLLENVKMKKESELVITQALNYYPIEINSALVSAQNRRRLYWTNINSTHTDLFGCMIPGIEQPEDKGLFLKDIIEPEVDKKYFMSEKQIMSLLMRQNKSTFDNYFKPITVNKAKPLDNASPTKQRGQTNYLFADYRNDEGLRIRDNGKAGTLKATNGGLAPYGLVISSNSIRRLTPIECERLQTVPDNFTAGVSESQRYKMLGNGWTVDVIAHIFKYLK